MTMPLNHDDCEGDKHNSCRLDVAALHPTMRRRWNNAAEMYGATHKNQEIKDLYSRLNYQRMLTEQLEYLRGAIAGDERVRVAYTKAGRPTATIVRHNHAILDDNLFQTECASVNEARYVLAFVNSNQLATAAETFMPRGLYGARHLQKHGWKLPIPRYDANDPLHVRLSELGETAEQECQALIAESDIPTKPAGDAQSRAARRLLRHEWQPNSATAQDIEAAVAELLSDPAQAALAERQMAEPSPSN